MRNKFYYLSERKGTTRLYCHLAVCICADSVLSNFFLETKLFFGLQTFDESASRKCCAKLEADDLNQKWVNNFCIDSTAQW